LFKNLFVLEKGNIMDFENPQRELDVLNRIIQSLSKVEKDVQVRLLQTVITFLNLEDQILIKKTATSSLSSIISSGVSSSFSSGSSFSDREQLTAKEFMLLKSPKTSTERVVCLAYYLTHYKDTPYFKTFDISKVNTEAAQQKFANAAWAVKDAARMNLLVPAPKGKKQLSAIGEQFVQQLPDRESARLLLQNSKFKRTNVYQGKVSEKNMQDPKRQRELERVDNTDVIPNTHGSELI